MAQHHRTGSSGFVSTQLQQRKIVAGPKSRDRNLTQRQTNYGVNHEYRRMVWPMVRNPCIEFLGAFYHAGRRE